MQSDPIGLLGGFNPYGYVFDPTQFIDPLGLNTCPKVTQARKRQHQMLVDNEGYNISPTSWDNYPSIGRDGTFISDKKGVMQYFGDTNGKQNITISKSMASRIERDMGLTRGSLQEGFKVRKITGINEMSPRSPMQGNEYFQGAGNHLPGGAPEMVINSVPTVDTIGVETILKVTVK